MNDKQYLASLFDEYQEKGTRKFDIRPMSILLAKEQFDRMAKLTGELTENSFIERLTSLGETRSNKGLFVLSGYSVLSKVVSAVLKGETVEMGQTPRFLPKEIPQAFPETIEDPLHSIAVKCSPKAVLTKIVSLGEDGFQYDGFKNLEFNHIRLTRKSMIVKPDPFVFALPNSCVCDETIPEGRTPQDLLQMKKMGVLEKRSFRPKNKPWIHKRK